VALTGDVEVLEEWRQSEMDARNLRAGQLSVVRAARDFASRYGGIVISIALALAAAIAAVTGLEIRIGS
jgi:hypothetical protein